MKRVLLALLLLAASLGAVAAPQQARPPLSKDEVLDLLRTSTPSKVAISTIRKYGIEFKPTPQVLEEFREAGADKAFLEALREAWHAEVPKPLGAQEIVIMLAEEVPSESIVRTIQERGIDFHPNQNYLAGLPSEGAKDVLIDALRTAVPRPFSKDELVQELTARVDQDWLAQKIQERAIDFEPSTENLQALRNAGAQTALLEAVRTAKRAQPFVAQTPASPRLTPPIVEGRDTTLICDPSDSDVPVLADPNDLGKVDANLHCGEHVTYLGKAEGHPGMDKIKYGDGKEGFVADSFLEAQIATLGGNVTAPVPIYRPDPPYTSQARHDRIEGTVSFWIIIDTQGNVSDIREVSKPLGEGLDKSALETVKTWKFHPATRDGVPVAVRVRVEVGFHLYQRTP